MPASVDMGAQRHRALQRTAHLPAERCHLVITPTPRRIAALRPPLEIITRVRAAGILSSPRIVPRDGNLGGDARLGAEEVPRQPLLRSDRAAWTSVFGPSIAGIVAHVRPGMLPRAQAARPNSFPTSGSGGGRETAGSQLRPNVHDRRRWSHTPAATVRSRTGVPTFPQRVPDRVGVG
jgi:hypothetical protein